MLLLHSATSKRAFTLIELLVVIVIIALLMAIAIPAYLSQQKKAKDAAARVSLSVGYRELKGVAAGNGSLFPQSQSIVSQIQASEPQMNIALGTDATSVAANNGIVLDNAGGVKSTTATAILYTKSGSGNYFAIVGTPSGDDQIINLGLTGDLFGFTPIQDNFNRVNGALASSTSSSGVAWSAQSINTANDNVQISSQHLIAAAFGLSGYLNPSYGPDTEAYATIPVVPASTQYVALWARIQSPGSGAYNSYALVYIANAGSNNDTWSLRRYDAGSPTVIQNISGPDISPGDKIGFETLGSGATVTLRAFVKPSTASSWSQVGSDGLDSSPSRITGAGKIGVEISASGSATLDDFGGGDK